MIVLQNYFVLVFVYHRGVYHTIMARYIAKWGIAQMCLCETKYQEGLSHLFGVVLTSLKRMYFKLTVKTVFGDNQPATKVPMAFPDSSSVLDKFLHATKHVLDQGGR